MNNCKHCPPHLHHGGSRLVGLAHSHHLLSRTASMACCGVAPGELRKQAIRSLARHAEDGMDWP